MRLQKFLAQSGVSSRRRAEQLIASGAVRVNGVVVSTLGTNVGERDRVEVDGRRVTIEAPMLPARAQAARLSRHAGAERCPSDARALLADAEPGWQVAAPLDFRPKAWCW